MMGVTPSSPRIRALLALLMKSPERVTSVVLPTMKMSGEMDVSDGVACARAIVGNTSRRRMVFMGGSAKEIVDSFRLNQLAGLVEVVVNNGGGVDAQGVVEGG